MFLACSNQHLKERLEKRAEQQGRPDDNPKATERRLANFKQNAVPLVKYFQEKGLIVTVRRHMFGFERKKREPAVFMVRMTYQYYSLGVCIKNFSTKFGLIWLINKHLKKVIIFLLKALSPLAAFFFLSFFVTPCQKVHLHLIDLTLIPCW